MVTMDEIKAYFDPRFDALDRKMMDGFDVVFKRFDQVDARFDRLEARMRVVESKVDYLALAKADKE